MNSDKKNAYFIVTVLFLIACFCLNYKSVKDVNWGYNIDSYRDIGNIQTLVSDEYGKDPSYLGEYIWYNPLVNWIEAQIVKVSGLPVPVVLSKSGVFLNFFAPVCFFIMLFYLFNVSIAFAATTGFLFFTINDLPGWAVATYSPWLYPSTFSQAFFYIGIILLYRAFLTEKMIWFVSFGILTGICFLSHTAPAFLLVLMMLIFTLPFSAQLLWDKDYKALSGYFSKRVIAGLLFILFSLPFTYFIVGKYKLQMINTITFEYYDPYFTWFTFFHLLRINLSVSFFIAVIGFFYFQRKIENGYPKKIINCWLLLSVVFYIYTSIASVVGLKLKIHLPGIVPVHHFFFYLKGVQAVFYGFGLVFLFFDGIKWLLKRINREQTRFYNSYSNYFAWFVLVIVTLNFPSYSRHYDLTDIDPKVTSFNNQPGLLEAYKWIMNNTSINDVFVCERDLSDFPLLASGRKMVAVSPTFSNAYLDYNKRDIDRNFILSAIKSPGAEEAFRILNEYKVSYILLKNSDALKAKYIQLYFPVKTFQGTEISIYKRN